jgi:hypothetical protein
MRGSGLARLAGLGSRFIESVAKDAGRAMSTSSTDLASVLSEKIPEQQASSGTSVFQQIAVRACTCVLPDAKCMMLLHMRPPACLHNHACATAMPQHHVKLR